MDDSRDVHTVCCALSGLAPLGVADTQGDALGYHVAALQAAAPTVAGLRLVVAGRHPFVVSASAGERFGAFHPLTANPPEGCTTNGPPEGGITSVAFAQPANPPAAAAAAPPAATRPEVPTIVVPYDPGQDPLQAARVFLPWEKFLELWNAAHPEKVIEAPAPMGGLVAEALYAVQVPNAAKDKKPVAEVSGRLVVHSFRDDQVTLPIPLGRVAMSLAQLDGKPAVLVTHETPTLAASAGELAVVVTARGVHVLDVKFTVPVEQTGPAGKFTLPLQPVAAGTMRFMLPADDVNLRVTVGGGTRVSEKPAYTATFRKVRGPHPGPLPGGEGDKEKTFAVIPVDQGGDVTVAWTPAQIREAAQGIVHVESVTALYLGDAGLRLNASYKYTVRQGVMSDVSYSLPQRLLVRQIAGLDLGGWEIAGEGAERTLKVFLRRPVNDTTAIQFDLYQAQAFTEQTQPVAMPQLVPLAVTRETGTIGVFAERQLAVSAGATSGISQIDLGQFVAPPPLKQPDAPGAAAVPATAPLMAYRFAARPVQLQLLVARQKPQSKGSAEHAVYVGPRKLRIASRLELALAGAPRSEIVIQLPPGYLLYDLKANDAVDYHVEARQGEQPAEQGPLLIVELSTPRTGLIELLLDGIVSRSPEDISPKIGLPSAQGIGESRSSVAIWLDRIYTATLEEFAGWKSVDPGELPERLRAAHAGPAQFAFTSSATALKPVALTLNKAMPRLSADALTAVIARDTSVQYLLYLRWSIAAAGESTFVFTTPDWLEDQLEFERSTGGVRVRQVRSEKIAGNRLRWAVTLDDPRTTVSTLIAQATLPPPDEASVLAPGVTFEQPRSGDNGREFQPLEQQRQYLVLVNQSPQRLDQEARDATEAIAADELPIKISKAISDQAAEILRVRDPKAGVAWRVQGAQQLKALAASVNLAKMTLVLAHDGSWRGLAQYRINNRARQFLALKMPPGSRPLSLFVGNQPSRPIDPKRPGEAGLVLVPLPKMAAGDLAVEVKLVYAGSFERPLPKGVQVLRSDLELPAPEVVSQGEFGIPVAATEWTVILPRDIDATRVEDPERSNVTESDEGVEEAIALRNEWQNLAALALDKSQSYNVQSRSENNLKQLGLKLKGYSAIESKVASLKDDNRQTRELRDLQEKKQKVEQQLQGQQAAQANQPAGGQGISNFFVQKELIAGNSADFEVDTKAAESDKLQLGTLPEVSGKPGAEAAREGKGQAQNPRGQNRAELRQQTESQSVRLNEAVNAQPEQKQMTERFRNPAGIAKDADADEVLNFNMNGNLDAQSAFWPGKHSIVPNQMEGMRAGVNGPGPGMMGGMGGGMGGFGRGELAANVAAADVVNDRLDWQTAAWTGAGGLSLPIEIPQDGQKLTFSKSGGEARLALGLRPRASLETGFGLAWTLVWLAVAVALIAALARPDALHALAGRLPLILLGLGLAWYFLLPAWALGLALFLLGAISFGWQHRRA